MLSSAHNGNRARPSAVVYAPSFFRSDDALLVALRQGHRGARAVFYQRHVQDVEALLLRILGVHENVSEITQAVFLSAVRRLAKFRGNAEALRAWLMRLAVREAVRALRRRRLHALLTGRLLSARLSARAAVRTTRSSDYARGYGTACESLSFAVQELKPTDRREALNPVPPNLLATNQPQLTLATAAGGGDVLEVSLGAVSPILHASGAVSHTTRGAVPQRRVYALLDHMPAHFRVAFCLHYIAQLDIGEVAELCCVSLSRARRAVSRGRDRFTQLALTDDVVAAWLV